MEAKRFSIAIDPFKVWAYDEDLNELDSFHGEGCKGIMSVYFYALRSLRTRHKIDGFQFMKVHNEKRDVSAFYKVKCSSGGNYTFEKIENPI